MKKYILLVSIFLSLFISGCGFQATNQQNQINMKISSPSFEEDSTIPTKFTCKGENINPELNIADVPENAQSLALIVDDPDAPAGTWTHWTIWNIDPGTDTIKENSVPSSAIEGTTSFGKPGYGGPCPPSGTHRYYFKLYALNDKLDLSASAKVSDLVAAFAGHILDQTEVMGIVASQ